MNTVEKGRLAEAKVVAHLVSLGLEVYLPSFGNGSCDLVVLHDDGLPLRVEVKYCGSKATTTSWEVGLRQVRANRATVNVKKFNPVNSDVLAVFLAELDVVVFFKSEDLEDRSTVTVRRDMVESLREFPSI